MAADKGHADAQYNLGCSYTSGEGVAKNDETAVKYYRMAADQGHDEVCFLPRPLPPLALSGVGNEVYSGALSTSTKTGNPLLCSDLKQPRLVPLHVGCVVD